MSIRETIAHFFHIITHSCAQPRKLRNKLIIVTEKYNRKGILAIMQTFEKFLNTIKSVIIVELDNSIIITYRIEKWIRKRTPCHFGLYLIFPVYLDKQYYYRNRHRKIKCISNKYNAHYCSVFLSNRNK